MREFRITESDGFLSASLSLSMGVMLFSALYSMLPQSKLYLQDGGYSPRTASFMLIGLFLGGVVGIRVLSTALHHFMPSHVVDCDHSHDDELDQKAQEEMAEHPHDDEDTRAVATLEVQGDNLHETEETPLLSRTTSASPPVQRQFSTSTNDQRKPSIENGFVTAPTSRRPSLMPRGLTRTLTRYVSGQKENCDENGPCMGFSDPCGQDCFRAKQRRGSILPTFNAPSRAPTWRKPSSSMRSIPPVPESEENRDCPEDGAESMRVSRPRKAEDQQGDRLSVVRSRSATHHYHHPPNEHSHSLSHQPRRESTHSHSVGNEHHHHVPTNAFMSIGLQTSLAIALHKAPEGFITYATNHANPTLGFAVFMALFIHNITEGFAMSLPLYLALGSRFKAILWSSLLGGLSQPLGAGVAALWFHLASRHKLGLGAPSEGVYGGMFAVTAGVMTSVALSLFSESLQLSHNKGMCIAFAFIGMGVLGLSSALTAK
jgi:zinc transporter, ZIP family